MTDKESQITDNKETIPNILNHIDNDKRTQEGVGDIKKIDEADPGHQPFETPMKFQVRTMYSNGYF